MELDLDQEIIKTFELETMSPDAQTAAVDKLKQTIIQSVGVRLTTLLSNDEMQQFTSMAKSGDEDGAFDLIGSKVHNFQQIVREEIASLKSLQDEMFGGMQW